MRLTPLEHDVVIVEHLHSYTRPVVQPRLGLPAGAALALLLLQLTSLDMDLAKRFYDAEQGGFIQSAGEEGR